MTFLSHIIGYAHFLMLNIHQCMSAINIFARFDLNRTVSFMDGNKKAVCPDSCVLSFLKSGDPHAHVQ